MAEPVPLHPSLPRKPSNIPLNGETSNRQLSASSSTSTSPILPSCPTAQPSMKSLCSVCNFLPSKYTCPGCLTRTCSLPCSTNHKTSTGCTGQRNKAAYVSMNKYTWGTMVDDYVFLEEVGRKVGEWGREIAQGGYSNNVGSEVHTRGGIKGRGRGRGRGDRGRGGNSKRDILKLQLELKDIEVDLLPLGMEKRKLNQSIWDFKKQTALLTIEFIFHKPKDPLAPASQPTEAPFIVQTHKNDVTKPLLSLIRERLNDVQQKSKKTDAYPAWLKQLIFPDKDDPEAFTPPQCVMATQLDPTMTQRYSSKSNRAYFSFDLKKPLATLLRHTHFVEFPTIEVWDEFEGTIVDIEGIIQQEEQRPAKRRKLNPKAGKKAIQGLLGDYGSSEEDEQENEEQNVLAVLGEYADSDGDEVGRESSHDFAKNDGCDLSEDDPGPEAEVDPAALLELIRKVQERGSWAFDKDDAVDWGDGDLDDIDNE